MRPLLRAGQACTQEFDLGQLVGEGRSSSAEPGAGEGVAGWHKSPGSCPPRVGGELGGCGVPEATPENVATRGGRAGTCRLGCFDPSVFCSPCWVRSVSAVVRVLRPLKGWAVSGWKYTPEPSCSFEKTWKIMITILKTTQSWLGM